MAGKPKKAGYLGQNGILPFKGKGERRKGKDYAFKIPIPFL
mgnify:CR=1 FL=1